MSSVCEHCGGTYRLGKTLQDDMHGHEYCDKCGKSKPYPPTVTSSAYIPDHRKYERIKELEAERDEALAKIAKLEAVAKAALELAADEIERLTKERDAALGSADCQGAHTAYIAQIVEQLHRENSALRQRVATLEDTMKRQQAELGVAEAFHKVAALDQAKEQAGE